jgi:hypothetical protein
LIPTSRLTGQPQTIREGALEFRFRDHLHKCNR